MLCLAAVALVSLEGRSAGSPAGRRAVSGVACGIAVGMAFGLYFLFIRNVASAGGLWPLALSGCTASTIVLTAAAWRRLPARLVLGERMPAVQRAGLALGTLGIILVTA